MTQTTEFLHRLTPHLFLPSTRRRRAHHRYIKVAASPTDDNEELASNSSSGCSVGPCSSLSSLGANPGIGAADDTQSSKNNNGQASPESEEAPSFYCFGEGEGSSSDGWTERTARRSNLPPNSSRLYYGLNDPRNQPIRISKISEPEAGQSSENRAEDTPQEIACRFDVLVIKFRTVIDKLEKRLNEMSRKQDEMLRKQDEILAALAAVQPVSASTNYHCCLQ